MFFPQLASVCHFNISFDSLKMLDLKIFKIITIPIIISEKHKDIVKVTNKSYL